MTITNEVKLANDLETLLRLGFDYLGIIDPLVERYQRYKEKK